MSGKKLARRLRKRLKRMTFAATARCACGAGMAYDATCVQEPHVIPSYWDCAAILLGVAAPSGQPGAVTHSDRLPFAFYEIKSEHQVSAGGRSTRPADLDAWLAWALAEPVARGPWGGGAW